MLDFLQHPLCRYWFAICISVLNFFKLIYALRCRLLSVSFWICRFSHFLIFLFLFISDESFSTMSTPHFILTKYLSHLLCRYYDLFIQRLFHRCDTQGWPRPKLGKSYFHGIYFIFLKCDINTMTAAMYHCKITL